MKPLITALVVLLACVFVPAAVSADQPNPTLDAIATGIAGKPVHVWCESSDAEWESIAASYGFKGYAVSGLSPHDRALVYVSPRICSTLLMGLSGDGVGEFWLSLSLLVLAHESVHQRGELDEGKADCAALGMIRELALRHFGYTATVREPSVRTVYKTVVRRVRGKRVKFKVATQKIVWTNQANPRLESLVRWATQWHRASGPAQQGDC